MKGYEARQMHGSVPASTFRSRHAPNKRSASGPSLRLSSAPANGLFGLMAASLRCSNSFSDKRCRPRSWVVSSQAGLSTGGFASAEAALRLLLSRGCLRLLRYRMRACSMLSPRSGHRRFEAAVDAVADGAGNKCPGDTACSNPQDRCSSASCCSGESESSGGSSPGAFSEPSVSLEGRAAGEAVSSETVSGRHFRPFASKTAKLVVTRHVCCVLCCLRYIRCFGGCELCCKDSNSNGSWRPMAGRRFALRLGRLQPGPQLQAGLPNRRTPNESANGDCRESMGPVYAQCANGTRFL